VPLSLLDRKKKAEESLKIFSTLSAVFIMACRTIQQTVIFER